MLHPRVRQHGKFSLLANGHVSPRDSRVDRRDKADSKALKNGLANAVMTHVIDYTKKSFELFTDASDKGIASTLMQKVDDTLSDAQGGYAAETLRIVALHSQKLQQATTRNY